MADFADEKKQPITQTASVSWEHGCTVSYGDRSENFEGAEPFHAIQHNLVLKCLSGCSDTKTFLVQLEATTNRELQTPDWQVTTPQSNSYISVSPKSEEDKTTPTTYGAKYLLKMPENDSWAKGPIKEMIEKLNFEGTYSFKELHGDVSTYSKPVGIIAELPKVSSDVRAKICDSASFESQDSKNLQATEHTERGHMKINESDKGSLKVAVGLRYLEGDKADTPSLLIVKDFPGGKLAFEERGIKLLELDLPKYENQGLTPAALIYKSKLPPGAKRISTDLDKIRGDFPTARYSDSEIKIFYGEISVKEINFNSNY